MPSVVGTGAQLVITGADAATIPARFSAQSATLRLVGGTAAAGPDLGTSLAVTTPKLDRALRQVPIGEVRNGVVYLTLQEQNRQQKVAEGIEAAFAALTTQVGDNTALIAQIQAALNLATAANDNANSALDYVNITGSYTDPIGVLTATSAGVITIAAHSRVYGDGTSVSVDGGSVSGFAPGSSVTVFYDDAAREGGAVAYQGTTSAVAQTGATHIAGQVIIPDVGQPDASGAGPTAPGWTLPDNVLEAYAAGYR